jgi:hypothetical protein
MRGRDAMITPGPPADGRRALPLVERDLSAGAARHSRREEASMRGKRTKAKLRAGQPVFKTVLKFHAPRFVVSGFGTSLRLIVRGSHVSMG